MLFIKTPNNFFVIAQQLKNQTNNIVAVEKVLSHFILYEYSLRQNRDPGERLMNIYIFCDDCRSNHFIYFVC